MRRASRVIFLFFVLLIAAAGATTAAPIRLRAETIEPAAKTVTAQVASMPTGSAYYLIQFDGPLQDEWRRELSGIGLELEDYIPEYAFVASMTAAQVRLAEKLPFVTWIGRLAPIHRVDPELRKLYRQDIDVLVRVARGRRRDRVEKLIRARGGRILSESGSRSDYVKATILKDSLDSLSALEEVLWIEEWKQPLAANNVAQGIVGVPTIRERCSLFGDGQIIAVADTGLDTGNLSTLSADFSSRLLKTYALRRPNEWSDLDGHGTHVAGIAVGSGILSGSDPTNHLYTGSFAGTAPEAQLIMQSMGDGSGFVYPPMNLSDMFQPVYEDGARVHSDSWGTLSSGAYTIYSQQVDEFAWTHRDMVFVFAAGNDGRDGNRDGVTDLGQIYAPGSAKNCITVGGTESLRTGSDGRISTYGAEWPGDFPVNPIKNDYISDNPGGMIGWSSRGPCKDGRFKPDICAPGTNIISCRSHATQGQPWWLTYDTNYVYWGGTSMSVPMVAGTAVLVKEYYEKNWGIEPSAALVKATLINGAKELYPGQYIPPNPQEVPLRPNNVEGWGRLDMSSALDPSAPKVVDFVDEAGGLADNESRNYNYQVLGSAVPLVVTLVWTDPPGSPLALTQLVNDLNLTVVGPDSIPHYGNGAVDTKNNVEGVEIASPQAGSYTVTVDANNVPVGPQPFALVVSGELPGSYVSGYVRTGSGNPITGAAVLVAGETSKTTTTGGNGEYTVHVAPGTYTVSVSKSGWSFDPVQRQVVIENSGLRDVNFTGSAPAGSITGTITRAVGGVTSYVVESPHPYYNAIDTVYTITGPPGATHIRLHFEEANVDQGNDFIQVEDPAGTIYEQLSDEYSGHWSNWVPGNTANVRLITNATVTAYGFYITGYETNVISQGGLAGVNLTVGPNGESALSQTGGGYTVEELEPISHTVTPSLTGWDFQPILRNVDPPPGGNVGNVDFWAYPPGTVTGNVTTGDVTSHTNLVESPHDYPVEMRLDYPVQGPPGTTHIRVHFDQIQMEQYFDYLLIMDANGAIIDEFTGSLNDVWSSWVPGDMLNIALISDETFAQWGFLSDKYESASNERDVRGVSITLDPGGLTAETNSSGAFSFPTVPGGRYTASVAKVGWTLDPVSTQINVAPGLSTAGVNFFAILTGMPDVASVKSLPDGDDVLLLSKVVTAGSSELSGRLYIEEANRSSGIKVVTSQVVSRGKLIDVLGTIQTVDGERQITATSITVKPGQGTVPGTLGVTVRSLGGGALNEYTPGVYLGTGLNNMGLLVRACGRVIAGGSDYFRLDDGSTAGIDSVRAKVICPSGVTPPLDGSFAIVTGISSCYLDGGAYVRAIRVRNSGDVYSW